MREARIICPVLDKQFEEDLIERFGGYTRTQGVGGWKNDVGVPEVEPIYVYDIATTQRAKLVIYALQYGRRNGQKEVYLRMPEGDVHMLRVNETTHLVHLEGV